MDWLALASLSESYAPDTCTHIQACTHIHIQACTHTACTHTCKHALTLHAHTHTRTRTYARMHAHTQARTYTRTHVTMHVCTHARTHTHMHVCTLTRAHTKYAHTSQRLHLLILPGHEKGVKANLSQACTSEWRHVCQTATSTHHTAHFILNSIWALGRPFKSRRKWIG